MEMLWTATNNALVPLENLYNASQNKKRLDINDIESN